MINIKILLKKLFYNTYTIVLILLLVAVYNLHELYKYTYQETYSISYRAERLTIELKENYYLETYRLHDYLRMEDDSIEPLINPQDNFTTNIDKDFINGTNTFVDEEVENSLTRIESQLVKNSENELKYSRKIFIKDHGTFNRIKNTNFQIVLGGGDYNFNEGTLTLEAGKCTLNITPNEGIEIDFQNDVNVLTLSNPGQKQVYEFDLNLNINCE